MKIILSVCGVLVLIIAGIGGYAVYRMVSHNATNALKAVRKIDTNATTGVSLDRFQTLLADAHEAYDADCTDPKTLDDPCYGMRMALRQYDAAARDWREEHSRPYVEVDLDMAHTYVSRIK